METDSWKVQDTMSVVLWKNTAIALNWIALAQIIVTMSREMRGSEIRAAVASLGWPSALKLKGKGGKGLDQYVGSSHRSMERGDTWSVSKHTRGAIFLRRLMRPVHAMPWHHVCDIMMSCVNIAWCHAMPWHCMCNARGGAERPWILRGLGLLQKYFRGPGTALVPRSWCAWRRHYHNLYLWQGHCNANGVQVYDTNLHTIC